MAGAEVDARNAAALAAADAGDQLDFSTTIRASSADELPHVSQTQRIACYTILAMIVMVQLGAGIFTIIMANRQGSAGSVGFVVPVLVPFTFMALLAVLHIRRLDKANAETASDTEHGAGNVV